MRYGFDKLRGDGKDKKTSAVDFVSDSIVNRIRSGVYPPGSRLPKEQEICDELGVSRGSLREAVKILDAFGIIEVKRGDGTYVCSLDPDIAWDPMILRFILLDPDSDEMLELRNELEHIILELAILHATEEDIENVRMAHYALKLAVAKHEKDLEILTDYDVAFHMALCRTTHNRLLLSIYKCVMSFFHPYITQSIAQAENYGAAAVETHAQAVRALEEKSSPLAESAAKCIVETWNELMFEQQSD